MGVVKDVARTMLSIQSTTNTNSRNIRHMLFLIGKIVKNQDIDDSELVNEEVLSQFIPCQTGRDLRELDRKLHNDANFFLHAVSKTLISSGLK